MRNAIDSDEEEGGLPDVIEGVDGEAPEDGDNPCKFSAVICFQHCCIQWVCVFGCVQQFMFVFKYFNELCFLFFSLSTLPGTDG